MIYLCSDWHFNHDREFVWGARGFSSIEEMNAEIVKRHNETVRPDDDVYVLGDCCLGGAESLAANKEIIESLNGKIHIITGNHCTNPRIEMYGTCANVVEVIKHATVLKYHKQHFYLSHYPTLTANKDEDRPLKEKAINICGHSHTKNPLEDFDKGLIYHVEMEAHNCYPVLLDDIIKDIKGELENGKLPL